MFLTTSDRGRFWRRLALLLFVLALVPFLWQRWGEGVFQHGGSWLGIVYGAAAFLLVGVLMAFAWRKRAYGSTWGTLEGWLQAHVYLGLLAAAVALLHTGFRFQDRVAVAAYLLLLAVVATGLVGAYLYQVLPRRLTAVESNLTAAEISAELNRVAGSMARLASGRSPTFQRIHHALLEESAPPRWGGWRILFTGRPEGAGAGWEALLGQVDEAEREELRRLLVLARQHKELQRGLVVQQRYRNLLDAWLWLHVPLSVALVVVLLTHVVAAFYWGLG